MVIEVESLTQLRRGPTSFPLRTPTRSDMSSPFAESTCSRRLKPEPALAGFRGGCCGRKPRPHGVRKSQLLIIRTYVQTAIRLVASLYYLRLAAKEVGRGVSMGNLWITGWSPRLSTGMLTGFQVGAFWWPKICTRFMFLRWGFALSQCAWWLLHSLPCRRRFKLLGAVQQADHRPEVKMLRSERQVAQCFNDCLARGLPQVAPAALPEGKAGKVVRRQCPQADRRAPAEQRIRQGPAGVGGQYPADPTHVEPDPEVGASPAACGRRFEKGQQRCREVESATAARQGGTGLLHLVHDDDRVACLLGSKS